MTKQAELIVTQFDHNDLKQAFIEYIKTQPGFEDVNYEGSAINTIIDLLVRNGVYTSFQANMVANESFIQSAQLRGNVSSHAQKLSYLPRSRSASRSLIDLTVKPSDTPTEFAISEKPGLTFLATIGGETYTYTTRDTVTFVYSATDSTFKAIDIPIYQGQYLTVTTSYTGDKITINNRNIDTSTLRITVDNGEVSLTYSLANSLNELGSSNNVYFLSENTQGLYEIEFGKNLIGVEPTLGSIITMEYINTQDTISNGVSQFIAASTIGDYSNIEITVKEPSYGGYDRDSIDDIRFLAPRAYQAQNRALSPTDYEILVQQAFPFIRSVRAWGGQDNDPPRYGNVLIAVIPDAGLEITSTLENRIISTIFEKAVGSVTPVLVQANIFELDLSVDYKVRSSVANTIDYSSVEAFILETIMAYSNENLRRFNVYYNESELIDLLKNRRDIEMVSISKIVSNLLTSYANIDSIYEVFFDNPIKPYTVKVENFQLSKTASTEKITDNGFGKIIHTYTVAGLTKTDELGTIDYETGAISFIAKFVNTNPTIKLLAEPDSDNFYVSKNNSVEIATAIANKVQTKSFTV